LIDFLLDQGDPRSRIPLSQPLDFLLLRIPLPTVVPQLSNSLLFPVFSPCAQSFLLINSDPSIGYSAHATTFECVVHGVGAAGELKEIRKKLADKRPTPVPFLGNKLKVIPARPKKSANISRFCVCVCARARRAPLLQILEGWSSSQSPIVWYSA
jgi:hypothetical protein